jgi:hypothetical protein
MSDESTMSFPTLKAAVNEYRRSRSKEPEWAGVRRITDSDGKKRWVKFGYGRDGDAQMVQA